MIVKIPSFAPNKRKCFKERRFPINSRLWLNVSVYSFAKGPQKPVIFLSFSHHRRALFLSAFLGLGKFKNREVAQTRMHLKGMLYCSLSSLPSIFTLNDYILCVDVFRFWKKKSTFFHWQIHVSITRVENNSHKHDAKLSIQLQNS